MTEQHDFKLGDKVYHPVDRAPFEVVGIRKDEVEIYGDWSGGTHPHLAKAPCWVKPNEIQREPFPELEFIINFKLK